MRKAETYKLSWSVAVLGFVIFVIIIQVLPIFQHANLFILVTVLFLFLIVFIIVLILLLFVLLFLVVFVFLCIFFRLRLGIVRLGTSSSCPSGVGAGPLDPSLLRAGPTVLAGAGCVGGNGSIGVKVGRDVALDGAKRGGIDGGTLGGLFLAVVGALGGLSLVELWCGGGKKRKGEGAMLAQRANQEKKKKD